MGACNLIGSQDFLRRAQVLYASCTRPFLSVKGRGGQTSATHVQILAQQNQFFSVTRSSSNSNFSNLERFLLYRIHT